MKVRVDRSNLVKALNAVKPSLGLATLFGDPVVLLEAGYGSLRVSATNLGTYSVFNIGASTDSEGKALAFASLLGQIVGQPAYEGVIELSSDPTTADLTLRSLDSGNHTLIRTKTAVNFPTRFREQSGWQLEFALPFEEIGRLLSAVAPFVAQDQARPSLTAVCLDVFPDRIQAAATDGFRLAYYTINVITAAPDTGVRLLLPVHLLKATHTLAKQGGCTPDHRLTVSVRWNREAGEPLIKIATEDDINYVGGPLLDGKFPDFTPIIPKHSNYRIEADVQPLLEAARAANIIAASRSGQLAFALVAPNKIKVWARGEGVDTNDGLLDVVSPADAPLYDLDADDLDQAYLLNAGYLVQALAAIATVDSKVTLAITTNSEPVLITPSDADLMKHVIMPMKYNR